MAQGVAYRCSKVECEDHSAILAPQKVNIALLMGKFHICNNFQFSAKYN